MVARPFGRANSQHPPDSTPAGFHLNVGLLSQISLNRVHQKNADAHGCNNRNYNIEHGTTGSQKLGVTGYVSQVAERFTEARRYCGASEYLIISGELFGPIN
jgi:hypothetical protein